MTTNPPSMNRRSPFHLGFLRPIGERALVVSAAVGLIVAAGCGRTGDDQPVNAACDAPATTRKAPYPVTFHFRDDGAQPVFVHTGCAPLDYEISSCAGAFRDQLALLDTCGVCDCAAATCQPSSCGQCAPDSGLAIAPGAQASSRWDGVGRTLNAIAQGQCVRSRALPAGTYRVAIRVFETAADAERNVGGRIVARDFVLPADNDVVDVPIGAAHADACEQDASGPFPTCTGQEARDVRCDLDQSLAFEWDGGLALQHDRWTIAPAAQFTAHREFFGSDPAQPARGPLDCTATIPRCSADARVVTTSDITRALAASGVAGTFADPMAIYGMDDRPSDGAILSVTRPDGRSVGIGGTCQPGTTFCTRALPANLQALSQVLVGLQQQTEQRACPAFLP